MNQAERLRYLIAALIKEQPKYRDLRLPVHKGEQEQLLRGLMNVRPPIPASEEFLHIQDVYLQELLHHRGVTDAEQLTPCAADQRIALWKGDITALKVDAIVNAANHQMLGCFIPCHGCIDNAIHSFAGVQLRLACNEQMLEQGRPEETGNAKITPAFNLLSRYVIHTVGPVIQEPLRQTDRDLLAACYRSCLQCAEAKKLSSIAFCCISTGEFHFPNRKAAEIAVQTVTAYLDEGHGIKKVIFNVFKGEDHDIYTGLLG